MAIPRYAPLVIVDGVVREVSRRSFTDRQTGAVEDRGRKAILMTARGFIEVSFKTEDDGFPLVEEQRLTVWCSLSEWKMDSGNAGSTLTFEDAVTRDHLDDIAKSLPQPVKSGQ